MTTDTKTPGDKTLSVSSTKTLTLKPRSETGVVRQSLSHGRSKAVVVEKVRRRPGPGDWRSPTCRTTSVRSSTRSSTGRFDSSGNNPTR